MVVCDIMKPHTLKRKRSMERGRKYWYQAQRESPKNGKGHVYICSLGYDGLYKIGKTTDVARRLSEFKTICPKVNCIWSAFVPKVDRAERILHRVFKKKHYQGEVFRLTYQDIKKANNVIDSFKEKYRKQ